MDKYRANKLATYLRNAPDRETVEDALRQLPLVSLFDLVYILRKILLDRELRDINKRC